MASLERLPSGRWRVRWREGGRWRKSSSDQTKAEAVARQARIESELAGRRAPKRGETESLTVLRAAWIAHKIAAGRDPDHTRREDARLAALLRRHAWSDLTDLAPSQVDAARAGRWSPRAGALLAACLRWAVERRGAAIDPRTITALRPDPPRRTPPRQLVAAAEVARWQRTADRLSPAAGALVHCLTRYGWRPITAARLRCRDLAGDRIRVPVKGGDIIEHPILSDTARRLARLARGRDPGAPLFLDPRRPDRGFDINGTWSIPQWWRDHLGAHSYDAKRWAISHLLRHAPPHEVARITGHRCPAVLFRYALSAEERSRDILAQAWAHGGHTRAANRQRRRGQKAVKATNDNETPPGSTAVNGGTRF